MIPDVFTKVKCYFKKNSVFLLRQKENDMRKSKQDFYGSIWHFECNGFQGRLGICVTNYRWSPSLHNMHTCIEGYTNHG